MKIWLVVYLAGKIAGSVGPAPDMEACEAMAKDVIGEIRTQVPLALKCESSAEPPAVHPDFQPKDNFQPKDDQL